MPLSPSDVEAARLFPDEVITEIAAKISFCSQEAREQFPGELRKRAAWIIGYRRHQRLSFSKRRDALQKLADRLEAEEEACAALPEALRDELAPLGLGNYRIALARFSLQVRRAAIRHGEKHVRDENPRLPELRLLAELWDTTTGQRPTLIVDTNDGHRKYSPSLDFARQVLSLIGPPPGPLTGLCEDICTEFRQDEQNTKLSTDQSDSL